MTLQLAVNAGSQRALARNFSLGRLTAMTFPPHLSLPRHQHPEATVAVILRGGFLGTYAGVQRDCSPMTLVVEPAGASHDNRFAGSATTVLTLSLAPGSSPAVQALADTHRFSRDAFAAGLARQADAELRSPDELTPLAVEALGLELVARLARTPSEGGAPAWLAEARDLLHERLAESLRLSDVASAVGVEADRLARAFRRVYREPMATYVRRLRVNAAAELLGAGPDPSIAAIAADVGFADQSHLTRCFVRTLGTTPARYRETHLG
jgi:AraC-like DNA-binding protein